jgi:hypothetical protein
MNRGTPFRESNMLVSVYPGPFARCFRIGNGRASLQAFEASSAVRGHSPAAVSTI